MHTAYKEKVRVNIKSICEMEIKGSFLKNYM